MVFSIIDMLIANLTFFASMMLYRGTIPTTAELYSRPMWLVLNVAMMVCVYFYSSIHERRAFYAERVVGQALKLVLTHAGIFITLSTFLGAHNAPWQRVLLFYVLFFIVLSTWWVLSRQVLKIYRNQGFNFKRVIIIGGGTVGVRLINEMLADQGYGYHIVASLTTIPRRDQPLLPIKARLTMWSNL